MTDRKRFDDDVVAPRKHIDRDHVIDLDPPEKAGAAPSLRDRLADRLGDRFDGIDAVDRIGGGDDDGDPPVGGPAHPIEIDLELVELDRGDRELIESPIDGGDGESSELGLDRPRPVGLTYEKITWTDAVTQPIDTGEGYGDVEFPLASTAQADGSDGYYTILLEDTVVAPAQDSDGFALQIDGANAGVVDDLGPEM